MMPISQQRAHLRTPVCCPLKGPINHHLRGALDESTSWVSHGVFPISKWSCKKSSSPRAVQFFFMHFLSFPRGKFFPAQLRDLPMLGLRDRPQSNTVPFPLDPWRLTCMSLSNSLGLALCFLSWALVTWSTNVVLQACVAVCWQSVRRAC